MHSAMPLRIGSSAQFAAARAFLAASEFTEARVCASLKLKSLSALGTLKEKEIDLASVPKPLATLIRLFILLQSVSHEELQAAMPAEAADNLKQLDLVRHSDTCVASVFLYPVLGFVVASDRHANADGSPFDPPPDVVFPAIFPGTLRFLRLIPKSGVDEALDLCSGSGVGALLMSGSASKVVASDITARAAHFAEFNRLLNGLGNVESVQGDLYEPVRGRTFDRITAHPPYVPSLGDEMVFRDGGEVGETVLRRCIEGLPSFLRAGGTFTALCIGVDTNTARFEARIRSWLGAQEASFDVIFACGDEKSPEEALKDISGRADKISAFNPGQLARAFETMGATKISYGTVFIRRRITLINPPLTLRPKFSVRTDGACLEWLVGWHDRRNQVASSIPTLRPRLAAGLLIKSTYQATTHGLAAVEFFLETDRPFSSTTRFDDPWLIPLIAQCNAERTLAEIHASARAAKEIPAQFQASDFGSLALMLIERGYLEIPEWPLPNPVP